MRQKVAARTAEAVNIQISLATDLNTILQRRQTALTSQIVMQSWQVMISAQAKHIVRIAEMNWIKWSENDTELREWDDEDENTFIKNVYKVILKKNYDEIFAVDKRTQTDTELNNDDEKEQLTVFRK